MWSNQTLVGQKQEDFLGNDAMSASFVMTGHSPQCAWCLCEQGIELGNGSHGICPEHAEMILREYRERRMRRHLAA